MADYISIGKFVAVHGLKGALVLKHALGKKTSLAGLKAIFVEETRDSYLPWFVQDAKGKTDTETLVKLEELDSPEDAKKLNQKMVWLTRSDFDKQVNQSAAITYIGYRVFNNEEYIGDVLEVIEQPHQVLCSIQIQGKEAYIPVHKETLKRVDRVKKELYLELPEGLLEIYLD